MRRPTVQGAAWRAQSNKFRHAEAGDPTASELVALKFIARKGKRRNMAPITPSIRGISAHAAIPGLEEALPPVCRAAASRKTERMAAQCIIRRYRHHHSCAGSVVIYMGAIVHIAPTCHGRVDEVTCTSLWSPARFTCASGTGSNSVRRSGRCVDEAGDAGQKAAANCRRDQIAAIIAPEQAAQAEMEPLN